MPDNVPSNQKHAHLFKDDLKKVTIKQEPFTFQLGAEIPATGRYDKIFYGIDNEELYARRQSATDQLVNGATKMLGSFTTSFLEGTVGLINGMGSMRSTGKFSSFYDNEFNRKLDDFNKYLEDALPNYYTQAEKDAEWYSPKNIFSSNFLGDKVLKNLGYSFGALAGGGAWGAVLRGIGLTNRLVRAGQALRTVEAVENAITAAPKVQKFGAIEKTLNSLWQSSKNAAGVAFSNSERGIISSMGMFGEATIEAYQASNDFRNNLIEEYKGLYGFSPKGEDLEEINNYADSVGNNIFGSNAVLLTLSNYLQLPKILGSSKTLEKRLMNDIVKEGGVPTAKFVSTVPSTGNILSPIFNKLGKPGRAFDKFVLGPGRLAFSVGEAFEEGAQYAIQKGTEDFFDRANKNPEEVESLINGTGGVLGNIFTEGVRRALSDKEGLESILIGGFSGALQKVKGNIVERGITGTGGVFGKNTQLALNAVNKTNLKEVLKDGVKYAGIAMESQKLRQQAIVDDDVLSEKDYEKDYALSYIMPRVKYGKGDSIRQEVGYYREQVTTSPNGFEELQNEGVVLKGEKKERFLERLSEIENTAKEVEKLYETLEDKYSTIISDKGERLYSPEVIDRLVYSAAKVNDYDKRLASLSGKLSMDGVAVNELVDAISKTEGFEKGKIKEVLSVKEVKDAIDNVSLAIMEKNLLEPDAKLKDVLDLTRMVVEKQSFVNDYNEIRNSPKQFKEAEKKPFEDEITESPEEEKEKVKIVTQSGEKEYELNVPYFVGKGIDYKKDGLDAPVKVWSMTILKENADGTIRIRDNKGEERDISKEVLADYKLGKQSDLKSNKTANYFYNHRNEVFEYNFGKDFGGKKPGRLEYDNGKLFFVYLDGKGKLKRKELFKKHFVPQQGYTEARIKRKGVIESAEQKTASEEFTSPEELEKEKEEINIARRRDARLKILNDLFDEVSENHTRITTLIKQKNNELQSIVKELEILEQKIASGDLTKKNNFKASTSRALQTANRLSKMREQLRLELESLEAEKEETQLTMDWLADISLYIDELPSDSVEFLQDMKEQKVILEDLILENGKQMNDVSNLISRAEDAIKEAVNLIWKWLNDFEEAYPNVPTSRGQEWVDFLKANPNFLKFAPNFSSDLSVLEDMVAQIEDFTIKPQEKDVVDLKSDLQKLQSETQELEKQLKIKSLILERFEQVAKKHKEAKEQEERIFKNAKILEEALGTADKSVQTVDFDESTNDPSQKSYEKFDKKYQESPKKSTPILPRATMGVVRGKPHQIRANKFGFNFQKFSNRDDIRGVYVTSKTEDSLIPGITDRLRMDEAGQIDENVNKENIIAMVMVQEIDGELKLLGVDGKPLPDGVDKLDNAIYQVYPDEGLKWSSTFDNESMFREGTADNVIESVKEQYKKWREGVLSQTQIERPRKINASFGFLEKVKDDDGNINYSSRTSVEDAGLIKEEDLETSQLITIPTLVSVSPNIAVVNKDTSSISVPVGTPLLELSNGLVKLQNRKHTEEEAEAIYQAILQLAKYMIDPSVGIKDVKSKRILTWLKSVVYWGIPEYQDGTRKPAGYNSVFFEKDADTGKLMLTLSGRGKDFRFTPSSLEENKETIMLMLNNMYNNINNSMVKNTNEPYEEILSISESGEITSRIWNNYQSYLLSNKTPDGKKRSGGQLPLSTLAKPLSSKDDVNRTAIYFYTTDTVDDFVIPVAEKKTKVLTPEMLKPAPSAPPKEGKVTAPPEVASSKEQIQYILDGKTVNEYLSPKGLLVRFTATPNALMDNIDTEITIYQGTNDQEKKALADAMKKIQDAGKDPRHEIRKVIFNEIAPLIDKMNMENEIVEETVVVQKNSSPVQNAESNISGPINQSVLDAVAAASVSMTDDEEEVLREIIDRETKPFESENWDRVEKWLKANFPNVPVYRVKNVIQATNGRQAWGMFKDGAIYIYENAEVGTVYHEVFHAVWRMVTDASEQSAVLSEMRLRGGKFFDAASLKDIKYSEATDKQLEEKLAEEFRDYVQFKKIPAKPSEGRPFILKLFSDLVRMIKDFFLGTDSLSKVETMFKRIGEGYYKSHIPYSTNLSFAKTGIIDIEDAFSTSDSVFSLIGISDVQRSEIIQEMTYLTLKNIISSDRSLFEIDNINKKQLYESLKQEVLVTVGKKIALAKKDVKDNIKTEQEIAPLVSSTLQLMQNIDNQWDEIVERHQEYLKGYSIEFDENDNISLRDENNSGRELYQNATKIDNFKKANSAVKMLLSTVPRVKPNGKGGETFELSSIGGRLLVPTGEVYISMMNNLHQSSDIEDMMERLRSIAESDIKYRSIYKRIAKRSWTERGVDFSKLNSEHSLQLISSIWNTFKKQNPQVKNVFILENGEVVVGEANLSSAAQQIKREYINSIIFKARSNEGYFKYDAKKNVYVGDASKVRNVRLGDIPSMLSFLNKVGIPFTPSDVNKMGDNKSKFEEAVKGIRASIENSDEVATFSGKVLKMDGRLLELALIRASIDNPEFSSTYFNIAGERTQTFIGTNAVSDLADFFKNIKNFSNENVIGSRYNYLKTDSFAKYSNLLFRKFGSDGTPKKGGEDLFTVGFVSGLDNKPKGKRKESSNLTYKERLVQELNLNLQGWYLNLVPGDASIEWMIKMGNAISIDSLNRGMEDIEKIFKGYFLSEFELARENRNIAKVKGRKSKDLRFFKGILGEDIHNRVMVAVNSNLSPEQAYEDFSSDINNKLKDFIERDIKKLKSTLLQYGILESSEMGNFLSEISIPGMLTNQELDVHLTMLSVNYMIANIEMHKLVYSDPYQYEDELKRIKNFNSPRQAIISGSSEINSAFNTVWNKFYKKGDLGHTNFIRDYFRSATHSDVIGVINLPGYTSFKETDGSGIISMKSNRNFRIRASNWNSDEERQYRYDIAWEKRDKGQQLAKEDEAILKEGNPGVQSAYVPIKPIVSGTKLDKQGNPSDINNVMLDKFALYPVSYRIAKEIESESNLVNLYNKMQREDIDYIVFKSSRKVGAEKTHDTYKENGDFNDDPYSEDNIINVPFDIISVQAEVPSKEDNLITRGSQVTKLVTLDFMEAGVPIDFFPGQSFENRYKAWYKLTPEEKLSYEGTTEGDNLYKIIKENENLLNAITEHGYRSTLQRFGIKEYSYIDEYGQKRMRYSISDNSKVAQTLREEMLKREVNDNISDALKSFIKGDALLEATPAYQQVRNILYSIADKEFISPKMGGGMKVQIPSTFMESGARRVKDGLYESDVLKFYEKDGKRVAEVMLGRWFDSPLSDDELLDYFNNTEEGKKQLAILSGIGFRIPTQKQNSIDVIVIKKFLPKEFRDSVVIPAALVQKVGSDFDIDKLSTYLKNVYVKDGKPILIPYFGIGDEAIKKFQELYDKGEFLNDEERLELERFINEEKLLLQDISEESAEGQLMSNIFGKLFSEEELTLDFTRGIPAKEQIINKLYRKSLENQYIQTMENLVGHPLNYNNLIKPNSADPLKDLAKEIAEKTAGGTFDYTKVDNMLDRTFMSRLRHSFVRGKYAIGIAAVNQTNHSLNQRQPIYVDKNRLSLVSAMDAYWLGENAEVKFPIFNTVEVNGQKMPSLSGIKNKAGEYISDTIGMFIDGYVDISKGPWIMELGATPNVASTWLFLVKIGVPINTVAYFMNQPIIRDYLREIESAGYSWLFIDSFVEKMASVYNVDISENDYKRSSVDFKIPNQNILQRNLTKKISEMTVEERKEQYMMLREFLKYAKMAEHMFHVTQGSNYDTATFNDPYLVFKKQMQYEKALNGIICCVDNLLKNSFISDLVVRVNQMRDAYSTILMSDKPKIRNVVQRVLLPYVDMNDRDFVRVAQKVVNNLFDWAVQNDQSLNNYVKEILINDGGVGKEVKAFVNQVKETVGHPLKNNYVISILESIPSMKAGEGGVNNVELKMKDNKVYDQNNVIYGFRELRDHLKGEENPLYERIKLLAVLQNGLSSSRISFTSLLPYEDFEKIYNKTLTKLESMDLTSFANLDVFQRNNWDDDDIIPYVRAKSIKTKQGDSIYNPAMRFLPAKVKGAVAANEIPDVMTVSPRGREASSEYIVYTWDKPDEEVIAMMTEDEKRLGMSVRQKKAQMKKSGSTAYVNKGLFKKVYDPITKTPFISLSSTGNSYFVYKAINAWGDSYRANEFYNIARKSVIDNGFLKVENEVSDATMVAYFEASTPSQITEPKPALTAPAGVTFVSPKVVKLRDRRNYGLGAVNATMLLDMGYSTDEAGDILKQICS